MASDLISRSALLDKLNDGNIQATLDLPVEEVLGEDVDIDDFIMLLQEAIHIYREMVIKVISDQPTAYDVDAVVKDIRAYAECDDECANEYNLGYGCTFCKFNTVINFIRKGGV